MGDRARRAAPSALTPSHDDDATQDPRPFRILVMDGAHRQIAQISSWWHQSRSSVPQLFDDELDRALLRLAEYSYLGVRSPWRRLPDVRRLLVRRVGYVVFYRPRPRARRIDILAVWHARAVTAAPVIMHAGRWRVAWCDGAPSRTRAAAGRVRGACGWRGPSPARTPCGRGRPPGERHCLPCAARRAPLPWRRSSGAARPHPPAMPSARP